LNQFKYISARNESGATKEHVFSTRRLTNTCPKRKIRICTNTDLWGSITLERRKLSPPKFLK